MAIWATERRDSHCQPMERLLTSLHTRSRYHSNMRRPFTWTRLIRHVVVFALLGLEISYVVGWACLLVPDRAGGGEVRAGVLSAPNHKQQRMGEWQTNPGVSAVYIEPLQKHEVLNARMVPPYWMGDPWWGMDEQSKSHGLRASWFSAGYPMRCCRGVKASSFLITIPVARIRGLGNRVERRADLLRTGLVGLAREHRELWDQRVTPVEDCAGAGNSARRDPPRASATARVVYAVWV